MTYFKQLGAGQTTRVLLTEDGRMIMWGGNDQGMFGIGTKTTLTICILVHFS